jgi:hypothetical protein
MVYTTSKAPGVFIVPGAQSQQGGQPAIITLSSALIGATATSLGPGMANNTPVTIASIADLLVKFPGVPTAVQNYIQSIWNRFSGASLQFMRCFDSGGSPTTRSHIVAGCTALANLESAPMLVNFPETPGLITADISAVFTAVDTLCQATRLIGVFDCATATTTNTAAIAESDIYRAAKRHVGLHYGSFRDGANTIPMSATVIADQLHAINDFGSFVSAANKFTIGGDLVPALGKTDQEALAAKQINILRDVPGFGKTLYDDLLLATDTTEPRQYVSLIVDKSVQASLGRSISLFRTLDPGKRTSLGITAALVNLMDDFADAGALKAAVLADGTVMDRGYYVGSAASAGDQVVIDVIYAPVTALRQAIIRSSRVMV